MPEEYKIKYYNNENKLTSFTIREGKKWSECKVSNTYVKNIFEEADDGDGIISADEIKYLKSKLLDKNKNEIFENNELFDSLTEIHIGGNANDLANKIHDDICAKTKFRFPTTSEDIGVHILDITPGNVKKVLEEYQKIENKDLFSSIMNEYGMDIDSRIKYCRQIFNQLLKSSNISESAKNELKKEFEAELSRQKGSIMPASGKQLNQIAQKIIKPQNNNQTANNGKTTGTTTPETSTSAAKKSNTKSPAEKHYEDILTEITRVNVDEILYDYKEEHNESLFSSILKELELSPAKKINYCKQIFNKLLGFAKINEIYSTDIEKKFNAEINIKRDKWTYADIEKLDSIVDILIRRLETPDIKDAGETAPNGEINDFMQGRTGTCSVLATVKALSLTTKGSKILEDAIQKNPDGTITVHLNGAEKSYTFTKEEINHNTQLSYGDFETRAIEMAFFQYFQETEQKDIHHGLNVPRAIKLLTGNKNEPTCKTQATKEDTKNFNNDNHITICITVKKGYDIEATNSDGEFVEIFSNHAYTVKGSDDKYVYLINPHDTSKTIKMTIEEFSICFTNVYELDL